LPPAPRFKECRLQAGLTQQQAAARLGRTPSALAKWEQAANSPTLDDIYKLAEIYEVTPSDFFTENAPRQGLALLDSNILIAAGVKDRQRILNYLQDCARVFMVLPEEFSEHWVRCLMIAAEMLGQHNIGGSKKRPRRRSMCPRK
jgi:transcriptional regulator with XRE-family HTH domain